MNFHSGLIQNQATVINRENDAYTVLLVHADGPLGTKMAIDASPRRLGVLGTGGNAFIGPTGKFGATTLGMPGAGLFAMRYREDFEFYDQPFTIDWWEYRNDTTDARCSIARDTSGDPYIAYMLGWSSGGNQYAYFSVNGTAWDGNLYMGPTTANQYVHFAVVRSGNTFYTFRNGVVQATGTLAGALRISTGDFSIGYHNSAGTLYYFNGAIDEVRVSKGIARWTANFTPPARQYLPDPDLSTILLLHMDGTTTTKSFADASACFWPGPQVQGNVQLAQTNYRFGTASVLIGGGVPSTIAYPANTLWDLDADDFTIECWVFLQAAPTTSMGVIVHMSPGDWANRWAFYIEADSKPVFDFTDTGNVSNGAGGPTGSLTLNTWHHIAAVRKGTEFRCYTNGVSPGAYDFGAKTIKALPASPLVIGAFDTSGGQQFKGYIDEVRISKTARYTGNTFTPPATQHTPLNRNGDINTVWLMDDGPYDNSMYNHGPWDVATGVQLLKGGQVGRSMLLFNGVSGSYASWPNHSDFNFGNRDWTVEWWEYRQAEVGTIIARDYPLVNGGYTSFLFGYGGGGTLNCYLTSNGTSWDILNYNDGGTFGATTLNAWTHYAIERYLGTTIWLYKNGVLINGKNISAGVSILSSSNSLSVGNYASGASPYNGYVDNIRISNIARYGSGGFTPSQTPYPKP